MLPRVSTVFTAEVIALRLARLIRRNSIDEKYLVCSDSLSALQEFKNVMTYDHLIHRMQLEFHEMVASGYDVTLTWVPITWALREKKMWMQKHGERL